MDRSGPDGERPSPARTRATRRRISGSHPQVIVGIVTILLAVGIPAFVAQAFVIPSTSMFPTLVPSDRVLVNRLAYRLTEPTRGDVIVFRSDAYGTDLIKRVVGLAGDQVEIAECAVFVNGALLEEPYLSGGAWDGSECWMPLVRVPRGHVFVMGDARGNSSDSRVFGTIEVEDIVGRAEAIVWPPGRVAGL